MFEDFDLGKRVDDNRRYRGKWQKSEGSRGRKEALVNDIAIFIKFRGRESIRATYWRKIICFLPSCFLLSPIFRKFLHNLCQPKIEKIRLQDLLKWHKYCFAIFPPERLLTNVVYMYRGSPEIRVLSDK